MSLPFLTLLLVCQLIGEVVVISLGIPIPGPVAGMALLFVGLLVRGRLPDALEKTSGGLLAYLSLLFVPAGVGVMQHVRLLTAEWLPVTLALIGSTALTIIVTAAVMVWLNRLGKGGEATAGAPGGNARGEA